MLQDAKLQKFNEPTSKRNMSKFGTEKLNKVRNIIEK